MDYLSDDGRRTAEVCGVICSLRRKVGLCAGTEEREKITNEDRRLLYTDYEIYCNTSVKKVRPVGNCVCCGRWT